jgi:hypothetical protein
MSVYVRSETYGCFQMKIDLPKRFKDKDLKKDKEYKEWKKNKDNEFDKEVVKRDNDVWWENLTDEGKKKMLEIYPDAKKAKSRRARFISNPFPCKSFKNIKTPDIPI